MDFSEQVQPHLRWRQICARCLRLLSVGGGRRAHCWDGSMELGWVCTVRQLQRWDWNGRSRWDQGCLDGYWQGNIEEEWPPCASERWVLSASVTVAVATTVNVFNNNLLSKSAVSTTTFHSLFISVTPSSIKYLASWWCPSERYKWI